jgi:two-component system phosphate regulon sensor histidine kinase PhoR
VVVAALSALTAGLFLNGAIERHITDLIAAGLLRDARLARESVAEARDLRNDADPLAHRLGAELGLRVTIIAADGTVLGDTDLDRQALLGLENHAGRPEVAAAERDGSGRSVRYSTTVAEKMLYLALRIDPRDPGRGVVRLAVPLTAVAEAQREFGLVIVWAALLSVAAAGVFGWAASRGPARRLEDMARAAGTIASGGTVTLPLARGDDEFSRLSRAIGRMSIDLHERLAMLAREKSQLRMILDGMVEGVLLTDGAGTILMTNSAFERMFGAQAPLEGRRPLEAARVPALQDAVQAALLSPGPVAREIALGGAQGRAIRASLAPIREGESTVGAVAVFHDVTELKRLERVRSEFVANVSHELRTPLTAIKGYAEALRDGGLREPARAEEFVEVIQRHAERLRALIEDLLDLAAVEQGEARLTLASVRARDAVSQAEAVIRPAAQRRGQTLVTEIPEDLPDLLADKDRLAQVLINLLDNAVKFTPEGGRITVSGSRGSDGMILSVSDTGPGIPPSEIDRIFERFYRVDRSRDRREGGTGLGLAIARHLVQAMGGRIEVESVPGRGTTFRIVLRAA